MKKYRVGGPRRKVLVFLFLLFYHQIHETGTQRVRGGFSSRNEPELRGAPFSQFWGRPKYYCKENGS